MTPRPPATIDGLAASRARRAALALALALAGLFYPPASAGAAAPPRDTVNREFRQAGLGAALGELARRAGLELALDQPIPGTVTASFRGVSPDHALAVLLVSTGLRATRQGATLHVAPGEAPDPRDGAVIVIPRGEGSVDVEVCGGSLEAAARALAAAAGAKASVSQGLPASVVASLHALRPTDALAAIARACRAEVRRQGDTLALKPEPAGEPAPPPILAALVSGGTEADSQPARRVVPPAGAAADPPDPAPGARPGGAKPPATAVTAASPRALVAPEAPPAEPPSEVQHQTAVSGAVNMEFRDTDLPVVLHALCQGAGLDFVLEPDIQGKVTAKLRNTTWGKALEIILDSHGLVAARQGDTLVISRRGGEAREGATKANSVRVTRSRGGKLDLDASRADIREALRRVAGAAGLNVVASKDVSGQVTASLRGLSPEEVLVALADSCGANLSERGGIIVLAPKPVGQARQQTGSGEGAKAAIHIEKCEGGKLNVRASAAPVRDLLRELAAATGANIVAAPDLKGTIDLALTGVSAQDVLAAVGAHSGVTFRPVGSMLYAAPAPAELQAETFTLRYSKAEDVVKVLSEAIPDAKVAAETNRNVVVVAGTPAILAAARAIVEGLEKTPTQVTIEARLLETNLTGDEHLGIDWNTSFSFSATFPTVPHSWPFSKSSTGSYFPGYDPSDSRSRGEHVVPYAQTDDFKFGILSASGLSLVLHSLQQRSHTRMIANPTVTTMENREAKINMATKYPLPSYQVSDETGVLTVSGFEYKEFGTILTVTARVEGDYIILRAHPEVSRQSGTTTFQDAQLPIITSQETDTEVRIKDGETLVIAGLIREDATKQRNGLPFFSKLPLVGSLFRSRQSTVNARRNLMIFLTPHIVREADFARAAQLKKRHTEPMPNSLDEKLEP